MTTAREPMTVAPRHLTILASVLVVVVGGGLSMRGVLRRVADLYPGALPVQPMFVAEHAMLLYAALPVAVICAIGLLLAPGFLVALIAGGAKRCGVLAAITFGAAFLVRTVVHALYKLVSGGPLGPEAFAAIEVALNASLVGLLALRVQGGARILIPSEPADRRRLWWMMAIVAATSVLLLPTIFWQDLSSDGVEALEIGRSLTTHILPRFPGPDSGLMGLGAGMLAPAYLVGWFVNLIGPFEAAARLPVVLTLPLLFAVIADLSEHGLTARLDAASEGAIVIALAVFLVALGLSSSYTPYSADVSSPAAFDTMAILCMSSTLLFAWQGRTSLVLGFGLLGYLCRPTGLLVLLFFTVCAWFAGPAERRAQGTRFALAAVVCVIAGIGYEKGYLPYAARGLQVGYLSESILDRLRYLTLTDARRLLFVVVPCGILPAISLLRWRAHDPFARQVTAFCVVYFLFFYVQAFISLHHFVPAMILPIVVYWRMALRSDWRWRAPAALVAASVSLVLSLPRSLALDRSTRALGQETAMRLGNSGGDSRTYRWAVPGMSTVFPPEWEVKDPARERVGEPYAMLYYSDRGPVIADRVNYIIQPVNAAAPDGFTALATQDSVGAFVRDTARWRRAQQSPPSVDFRARVYEIHRNTMHGFLGIPAHAYQVDLARLPGAWRLFARSK